jgi:hypothetical protein
VCNHATRATHRSCHVTAEEETPKGRRELSPATSGHPLGSHSNEPEWTSKQTSSL